MSLSRDDAAGRYEMTLEGGRIGFANFRMRGDVVMITHVEVPRALEGKGHASALMKAILADIRARRQTVMPLCSFANAYMRRHRETQDLLAPTP
jgi:hypothetical protein